MVIRTMLPLDESTVERLGELATSTGLGNVWFRSDDEIYEVATRQQAGRWSRTSR